MKGCLFFGFLLLATRGHGRNIAKRSDDTDPLAIVVQSLSNRLAQLEAQLTADHAQLEAKDRHVAFLAKFSSNNDVTVHNSSPYKFNNVILNDGNGYDPVTGIFTAPVAGVYIISAQFFTYGNNNGRPLFDITINGNTYVRIGFDADSHTSTGEDSDSTSFTLKLHAGDRVWATSAMDGATYTLYGSYHTFFSGALLYSA